MVRNRQAHHNLSLTMSKHNPTSIKSSSITILYTHKDTKVRRYAPVKVPMNAFNKEKGELKKGFELKFSTQNKWIQKFKSIRNDLEIRMHNGEIEYEYAFKMLKNDYDEMVIMKHYRTFAKENHIPESVIQNNIKTKFIPHLFSKFSYSTFFICRNYKIIRFFLLEYFPQHLAVLFGISPISYGIYVSKK